MRTNQKLNVLSGTALCLLVMCSSRLGAAEAETTPTSATPDAGTNVIRTSVFVDDQRGKDPFFPSSTRRQLKTTVTQEPRTVGPSSLALLALLGDRERPLALINNKTFRAGEEQEVRVPGGSNTVVKCMEIREGSVMVTIQGGTEQFELQLRERTLPIAPDLRAPE
jgi:hypothetical protein